MNVRIYQINMKRDANNVAFMNYESLPKFQGSSEIDSSLYDKVFEGEVNCFTLEKLYEIFNLKHPARYKGRSMSVSDVVEIIDGNTGKSYFLFCDSFGFQKVDFDPEKTQVSDRFLSLAEQEKISVLLVPVGKSPIVKEIPNTYEAMKELVGGGGLDEYMPFEDDAAIVCNRDGKQEKLPMNRAVYQPPKRTQMSYSDLKSLFREAENNRQHLTAHIVFPDIYRSLSALLGLNGSISIPCAVSWNRSGYRKSRLYFISCSLDKLLYFSSTTLERAIKKSP